MLRLSNVTRKKKNLSSISVMSCEVLRASSRQLSVSAVKLKSFVRSNKRKPYLCDNKFGQ